MTPPGAAPSAGGSAGRGFSWGMTQIRRPAQVQADAAQALWPARACKSQRQPYPADVLFSEARRASPAAGES